MDSADDEGPPPHSAEAERCLLGALLMEPAVFDAVAAVVQESDFYLAQNRLVWRAVAAMVGAGRSVDIITIYEDLRRNELAQEAGGLVYLNELEAGVPSARHAVAYAGIIKHRALCRKLMVLGAELRQIARDAGPAEDLHQIIDGAVVSLLAMQQGASLKEPRAVADALPGWIDALNGRAEGLTDAVGTGLHAVDRLMSGGFRPGELVVVGARPSMGKSALCLTIARNVARAGPVLLLSMEDSEQMLISRQVAALGRVNLADLRNPARAAPSIWQGVSEGCDALAPLQLHIDDQPGLSLRDVRRKALQVKRKRGALAMVIVDYLQLMQGVGATRHEVLSAIAAGLKGMAKDLQCVVVLLSQLNREADKIDGPPRLDHLRESGGIEEAADIVGLLWREHRRKPLPSNKHDAQLEFAKHKNGPTDTVRLWFDGATQRFEDMADANQQ